MYKIDPLVLMTGAEIILANQSVKVHQPTVKEIALIGEDKFFKSMRIFYINADPLTEFISNLDTVGEEDKKLLIQSTTAYDNLLFLMQVSSIGGETDKFGIIQLAQDFFEFILKEHKFVFNNEEDVMLLMSTQGSNSIVVDRELFTDFKDIASQIFLLSKFFDDAGDNVSLSDAAQKIADKIAASEAKIRKMKNETLEDDSQLTRILSIMGVNKDLDYLSNLTVYQLLNQFERFNLFTNYDQGLKASYAGASNIELVDWYKKI